MLVLMCPKKSLLILERVYRMYCLYGILSWHSHPLDTLMKSLMDEQQDSDIIQSCCPNHMNNSRRQSSHLEL